MSIPNNEPNPFEQLQQEHEAEYDKVSSDIKANIIARKGFWSFLGDILDLYLPKVVDTFLSGAASAEPKNISSADQQSEL